MSRESCEARTMSGAWCVVNGDWGIWRLTMEEGEREQHMGDAMHAMRWIIIRRSSVGMIDTAHRDPFQYGSNHGILRPTATLVPHRSCDALSRCFRVGLSPSASPPLDRHRGGGRWAPSSQSRTRSARWEGTQGVSQEYLIWNWIGS